jgi:hypothetical protein
MEFAFIDMEPVTDFVDSVVDEDQLLSADFQYDPLLLRWLLHHLTFAPQQRLSGVDVSFS